MQGIKRSTNYFSLLIFCVILFLETGCGGRSGGDGGSIKIDGSSTVYPLTEAVAEEFRNTEPGIRVTIGFSGTGGGFKKFGRGEIDINDASRPIQPTEIELCKKNNIEYQELEVAYDGIAILVNPENDWLETITVEELEKIWEPEAQNNITKWSQIREEWPDKEINLYGPGVSSGTYDYFTEAIMGESGASRGDYMASEDDNVLVQGIKSDKYALGFFGLAYYDTNQEKLELVKVDDGNGKGVAPSRETVKNGTYKPLSRPLYIYVRKEAARRKPVQTFINFYLDEAKNLSKDVGYIPLNDDEYATQKEKFQKFKGPSS